MYFHHAYRTLNFSIPSFKILFKAYTDTLIRTLNRILLITLITLVIPTFGYCNNAEPFESQLKAASSKPKVQLAKVYDEDKNVKNYLVSEKYDGIRAIWKNGKLQTRNGNTIHAPKWFTMNLPNIWLDGELWSKRQDFEFIASTVRKHTPIDHEWKQIHYMVFDAPNPTQIFQKRVEYYTQLIENLALAHVLPVQQFRVDDNAALSSLLENYTKAGAEGLMLHKANALYTEGRSANLLKLKPYMDAEAIVIEHLPGKGKLKGLMGAIKVRWEEKPNSFIEFKIGTGFSNQERANPPKLGSTITFKYHGLTKNKLPRFASFLRNHQAEK